MNLRVENLDYVANERSILWDIGFTLPTGQWLGLLGANGAGKTSLLRILALIYKPTRGTIYFDDRKVSPDHEAARGFIGFLGHQPLLYPSLTGRENLSFFASLYGVRGSRSRITDLLQEVGLHYAMDEMVYSFSRGMQQRLAFARVLLTSPRLLLLDEPFTGLDVHGVQMMQERLQRAKRNGTSGIIISHQMAEISPLVDRVILLRNGHVVADKDGADLSQEQFFVEIAKGAFPG